MDQYTPNALDNFRLMQHWISHVCHELVSPIGAINNGIELLSDMELGGLAGLGNNQDALDLIAESGRMAAAKLRLYRLAYGASGAGRDVNLGDVKKTALDYFNLDGRVNFTLEEDKANDLAPGVPQLILNLLLLASHCLPRGGSINCSLGANSPLPHKADDKSAQATISILIRAVGNQARIPELSVQLLFPNHSHIDGNGTSNSLDMVTGFGQNNNFRPGIGNPPLVIDHRNCHAAMCASLLQNLHLKLMTNVETDAILFCFEAPLR